MAVEGCGVVCMGSGFFHPIPRSLKSAQNPEQKASKLQPSLPPRTGLLSGVLYEVIEREHFLGAFWVSPGCQMPHNGPESQGDKEAMLQRKEALAQNYTTRSGGARSLTSVSWLLPIPRSKER